MLILQILIVLLSRGHQVRGGPRDSPDPRGCKDLTDPSDSMAYLDSKVQRSEVNANKGVLI